MSTPEHQILDRYLKTVFSLIEGLADVEEASHHLHDYLQWHRQQGLNPELESFLIEIFFDKCHREFTDPGPPE